jgi:hypothetical protein
MAKKRIKQEKPLLGGLNPVNKKNIVFKESLTTEVLLDRLVMKFRDKNNNHVDYIEVYGTKQVKHTDGTIIKSHTPNKPLFVIKDTGAKVEYDVFEESLWLQEDIDNETYVVDREPDVLDELGEFIELGAVTRIYWVDGQELDEDTQEMVDVEVDIDPYQKQGRIDDTSGVDLIPADEPLADWQLNIGDYIKTIIKDKFIQMYDN